MLVKCFYEGLIPSDLSMCTSCELFLETYASIASSDGFALGSKCGCRSMFCIGFMQFVVRLPEYQICTRSL